jgi:hypothetical protein
MSSRADFQLVYDGDALSDHTMDVDELAPALLAVGTLCREANRILNGFNEPYEMGRIEELPVRFPRIPYRSRRDREAVLNLVFANLIEPRGNGAIKLL